MTLEKLLAKACSQEVSEKQDIGMEQSNDATSSVNCPGEKPHQEKSFPPKKVPPQQPSANQFQKCGCFDGHIPMVHVRPGATLAKCGKLNHYMLELSMPWSKDTARTGKQGKIRAKE